LNFLPAQKQENPFEIQKKKAQTETVMTEAAVPPASRETIHNSEF
jgi:hypothetical protein